MSKSVPSRRELEILRTLWRLGPSTVREVHQAMCPGGELSFNTIQTILRIMDGKGLVSHKSRGRVFVYTAKHSRESEASRFLKRVFDNSLDQFVLALLKTRKPSESELDELERIVAEARRSGAGERKEK